MHDPHLFLQNLALVLGLAAVTSVLFQKLRQPVIFGYLLAGMIVGPYLPISLKTIPLIADIEVIRTLSELGVVLLMFFIGLRFRFKKLAAIASTGGFVALLEVSLMIWLGYRAGKFFGWTERECLYAGAMIAISSTTIVVKAFEGERIRGRLADLVFGILIAEDLIVIFFLAVLNAFSGSRAFAFDEMVKAGLTLAHFLVFALIAGILVVPRLMRAVVRFSRPETTLVASVGICFSMAWLAQAFGYSVALGAFLAGALVAESGVANAVEQVVRPVRDMFVAIFFVAVGMLFDPLAIAAHWREVFVLVVLVVMGKWVGVSIGSFLVGFSVQKSVRAGMSLAQIGEFSFILAGVGIATGATREFLYPLAIAVSGMTTLLTPWMIRAADPIAQYVDRHLPRPLQTFASLYGTWIDRMRMARSTPSAHSRIRRLLSLVLIDFSVLTGFTIGVSYFLPTLVSFMRAYTEMDGEVAQWAVIVVGAALATPFLLGIVRCAGGLAVVLAAKALPLSPDGTLDLAAAPRKVFVISLQLMIIWIVGIPFLALTQPFMPFGVSVSLFGACLFLLGAIFWRSVTHLEGHIKAGAEVVIEALSSRLPGHHLSEQQHNLESLLPGLGDLSSIAVENKSAAVGKTLSEINLRGLTGTTAIAITRSEGGVVVPTGAERLQEGDILTLAGTSEAIAAAQKLLH